MNTTETKGKTLRRVEKEEYFYGSLRNYDTLGHFLDQEEVQPSCIDVESAFHFECLKQDLEKLLGEGKLVYECTDRVRKNITGNTFTFTYNNKLVIVRFEYGGEYKLSARGCKEWKFYNVKTKKSLFKKFNLLSEVMITHHPEEVELGAQLRQILLNNEIAHTPEEENVPTISVITYSKKNENFIIRHVPMSNWEYKEEQLDMFYGSDFKKFHETLLSRFENASKGIALFHGIPGTGKTHFIRKLTGDLNKLGKQVLFIPSAIFDQIGSGEFTEFMLNNFGKNTQTVFILEDAEKLLQKRDESSAGADKVSNLLNLGDGIMNDLFSIQIIATFNTDLKNIDEAVLRSGRLLARKEFKELSIDDAKKAAKYLGIDPTLITKATTLAEIFSLKEEEKDSILISK